MEVEEGSRAQQSRVVVAGGASTTGSVSVSLHPLVIMNISDHFTRVRVQQEEGGAPIGALQLETFLYLPKPLFLPVDLVYGALLGTQKGRSIEICNSFELIVSNDRKLDREYFTSKEEQCMLTCRLAHEHM